MNTDVPPSFCVLLRLGLVSTVFSAGCLFDPMGSPGATDTVDTTSGTTAPPLTTGSTGDATGTGEPTTAATTATITGASTGATTGTTGPTLDEPYCGDGVVQPDLNEACDDADFFNDDACTNVCAVQSCGDLFIDVETEECDDGMQLSLGPDACSDDCKCLLTTCGDGVLDPGEECDDGNTSSRDGCSACCQRLSFFVFATSKTFKGGEIGGLAGGDALCTGLAQAAGLPGTYQAWLGMERGVPGPLMLEFPQPYALPGTGELVVHSLKQLRSGALSTAIHVDEHGQELGPIPADPCQSPDLRVWTGTEEDGEAVFDEHCGMWDAVDQLGRFGAAGSATSTWSDCEQTAPCDAAARLYCFEVQI